MKDTSIEWADDTVNIVEGCDEVDEDCLHCYAKGIAARFALPHSDGQPGHYAGLAKLSGRRHLPQWTGKVRLRPDVLEEMFWRLLRAPEPRRQFLCSMGDIFHAEVPDAFLDELFARIAILESRRRMHPIYMLTKRPERAAEYTNAPDVEARVSAAAWNFVTRARASRRRGTGALDGPSGQFLGWPRRSVAIIVSAGTQKGADIRVEQLQGVKAAIRGVSCEPMTEPVDFSRWTSWLDWIIFGGESGKGARACELAWIESGMRQCKRAGVAAFVKQLGTALALDLGRPGKGGKLEDLPEHLRMRQFPVAGRASLDRARKLTLRQFEFLQELHARGSISSLTADRRVARSLAPPISDLVCGIPARLGEHEVYHLAEEGRSVLRAALALRAS